MVITQPTPRVVQDTPAAAKLTYEDYLKTSDDERYELLDGELIMAPAPYRDHQAVEGNLGARLHMFVQERGLGRVYFAPRDVALSDTDVVHPDLLFISNERAHIDTSSDIQGAPDLVVEILSPSTARRDWTYKHALYAEHGVKEYWLVDPNAGIVWVLLLGEKGFEFAGIYSEGDTLTSPALEGFTVELDAIVRASPGEDG